MGRGSRAGRSGAPGRGSGGPGAGPAEETRGSGRRTPGAAGQDGRGSAGVKATGPRHSGCPRPGRLRALSVSTATGSVPAPRASEPRHVVPTRGDALPAGVPPPPARGRDRQLRAPAALASGPGGVAPFVRPARARSSVASWVPGSRRPTGQAARLLPVQAPLLGSAPPARGAVTGPPRPPPPSDDVYYALSGVSAPSVGVWRRGEPGPFPGAGREASRRSRDTGRDSFPHVPPPAAACVTAAAEPPGSCGSDPPPRLRRQWAADYNSRQAPRRPRSPGLGVLGGLSRWSRRGREAWLAGLSSRGAAGGLSHTPRPLGRPLADRLGAFRSLELPGRAGGTQTYGQVEGSAGALGSGRDRGPGRLPEEGGWNGRRRGGPGLVGRGHAWGCASALPSPARPAPAVPAEPRPGRSAGP